MQPGSRRCATPTAAGGSPQAANFRRGRPDHVPGSKAERVLVAGAQDRLELDAPAGRHYPQPTRRWSRRAGGSRWPWSGRAATRACGPSSTSPTRCWRFRRRHAGRATYCLPARAALRHPGRGLARPGAPLPCALRQLSNPPSLATPCSSSGAGPCPSAPRRLEDPACPQLGSRGGLAMNMLYNSGELRRRALRRTGGPRSGRRERRSAGRLRDRGQVRGQGRSTIEGALAESFKLGVQALIEKSTSVEELDAYIGRYSSLMQQPLSAALIRHGIGRSAGAGTAGAQERRRVADRSRMATAPDPPHEPRLGGLGCARGLLAGAGALGVLAAFTGLSLLAALPPPSAARAGDHLAGACLAITGGGLSAWLIIPCPASRCRRRPAPTSAACSVPSPLLAVCAVAARAAVAEPAGSRIRQLGVGLAFGGPVHRGRAGPDLGRRRGRAVLERARP